MHGQERHFKIMFYNVENLFDTQNDSLTEDDDFTPLGKLHWTRTRYSDKLNKIGKVIIAAGEWQPPAVIGLCEIENRRVLNDLIYNTSISKFSYGIIHADSPDKRGIDVGMLYDSKRVKISAFSFLPVTNDGLATRDILYAKTVIYDDTLHIFINHWPSRSSGQLETEGSRMLAAKILRSLADSLFSINPAAKIIIMGDFNDEPGDESIFKGLNAHTLSDINKPSELYNLSEKPAGAAAVNGTLKYQGNWNIFDQIIVSGMLLSDQKLKVKPGGYKIFYNQFMIETDQTYTGVKPFRTYMGFRYHGGFSDHLPVIVEIAGNRPD
jgi:endonuclease/exonuclease/phosphatase family metal-dependent hydrolase